MSDGPEIFVVHQNDGSDVRIGKICRSLSASLENVKFLGWKKGGHAAVDNVGRAQASFYDRQVRNSRATLRSGIGFLLWLLREVYKERPKVIYCVNEEMSFFFGLFRPFLRYKIVCDIFDPFADRKSHSRFYFVYFLVQKLGRYFSDRLVVTDRNRLSRLSGSEKNKAIIVENFPECFAEFITPENFEREAGCIYISFVGSLSERRGVSHLLSCLRRAKNLRVLCAGWLYDSAAEDFVKHPQVKYYGVVSAAHSRGIMSVSDFVFCIYDPSIVNNINASPNKIYDAMSVGRPSVINRGLVVSDFVERNRFGFLYDYDSIDSLMSVFLAGSGIFEFNSVDIRKKCCDEYSWEANAARLCGVVESLLRG